MIDETLTKEEQSQTRDPTTWSAFLGLSLPLMVSAATLAIQLTVDRYFLAQIGEEALAASLAGISVWMLQAFFFGACSYLATFIAQHSAANEKLLASRMLWPSLSCAAIGMLTNFIAIPFLPTYFHVFVEDPQVAEYMVELGFWYCCGSIPLMVNACFVGLAGGLGKTRLVMFAHIIAIIINVLATGALVQGWGFFPQLGVAGVGIGTIIGSTSGTLVYFLGSLKIFKRELILVSPKLVPGADWKRYCYYSFPAGLRDAMEIVLWQFFFIAVGWLGLDALMANNIVLGLYSFVFAPLMGISHGASIISGQLAGGGQTHLLKDLLRRLLQFMFGYVTLWTGLVVFASPWLLASFIPEKGGDELIELATVLLLVSCYWAFGDAVQYAYRNVLSGLGDVWWTSICAAILCLGFIVAPTLLIVYIDRSGAWDFTLSSATATWLSAGTGLCLTGFFFQRRYRSGAWRRMQVRGQNHE